MADTFSKVQRSQVMRSVRQKGTGPEKRCEKILRSLKIRFRRNLASLPGSPDFVLQEAKLAVFVHGCFWHGHENCVRSSLPTSNVVYLTAKIDRNRKRDRRVREKLRKAGWRTAVFWECKLSNAESVGRRLAKLTNTSLRQKKLG